MKNGGEELFVQKKKLDPKRARILDDFQKNLDIRFRDIALLNLAFFHRSVVNEMGKTDQAHVLCNERLEFLGDTVLDMVVATYLFKNLTNEPEGVLSQIKSLVVSEPCLAKIALEIGVDDCLVLGHGEEASGGRKKKAILADCVEAIIGAYYLDCGIKETEKFILKLIVPKIDEVLTRTKNEQLDSKSALQEWFQKSEKQCPKYILEKIL